MSIDNIYYRGKRIDNNEWIYGWLFKDILTGKMAIQQTTSEIGDDRGHMCISHVTREVNPETISQYIGIDDKNHIKIFEYDVNREENEHDEGDRVEYYVCKWISEWSRFAWLHLPGEYWNYMSNGIKYLDIDLIETFGIFMDKSDKYQICGNIFDTPNFTTIGQKDPSHHI